MIKPFGKPSFTEKTIKDQKANLVENDKIISEEPELTETILNNEQTARIFRNYFENIVENLNIKWPDLSQLDNDPVLNRKNFEQHTMILKIKDSTKQTGFSFQSVSVQEMIKKLLT